MTDPTTEFFESLRERGHEPRLRQATGTFRFELTKAGKIDRWHITLKRGDVTVLHRGGDADCIVRTDRAVFDRLASGELNGVAAVFRGELVAEGDWKLLVLFQRLFPGKAPSPAKRSRAGYSRRRA